MNIQRKLLVLVSILVLVSMACGIQVDFPNRQIKTGPVQTDEMAVPLPDSESVDLELNFGAGEFNLSPGADEGYAVSGSVTYNVSDLAPEIKTVGNNVTIKTGDLQINGIPNFKDDIVNVWDFELTDTPMSLKISAGAYKGNIDLGGLSLEDVDISDGASEVNLDFSQPNLVEMRRFRYQTGASKVTMKGLANANFSSMTFRSGAGSYTLNFSGGLQRDTYVRIESGISEIKLIVPIGTPVELIFSGGLTNVDIGGEWDKSGNQYTLAGTGPLLTIEVDMAAGSLQLRN